MRIYEVISERWQKGNPTKNQVARIVKHALKGEGNVTIDGNDVVVDMYWHNFIDAFTQPGTMDKILTMNFQVDKLDKLRLDGSPAARAQFNELHNKLYRYYARVKATAIRNARSFIPLGWLLTGNFDINYAGAANNKIELRVIRDLNPDDSNKGTYYHVTNLKNLRDIMANGLVPGSNQRMGFHGYRNRIYLFKEDPVKYHSDTMLSVITGANFSATDAQLSTGIAILKISLPLSTKVYVDPEMPASAVYVEDKISPENVEVVYQGPIRDVLQ